jgi:hypothetical protein
VIGDHLMSGAGLFGHAERAIPDVAILRLRCTEPRAGARGKLSTVSVDKFAEKISAGPDSSLNLGPDSGRSAQKIGTFSSVDFKGKNFDHLAND